MLDPNIPLSAARPIEQPSFQQTLGSMMQLRNQQEEHDQVGQLRAQQIRNQQAQEQDRLLTIDKDKRGQEQNSAIDQIMAQSLKPNADGVLTFDRPTFEQGLVQQKLGHLYPQLSEQLDKLDASTAKARKERIETLAGLGYSIHLAGNTPEAFLSAASYAKANQLVTDQQLQPFVDAVTKDPSKENIARITQTLIGASPAYAKMFQDSSKPIDHNPEHDLMSPDGTVITPGKPAVKPETRSLDVQAADALAKGDMATYTRLLKVKKEMGQADDRPVDPTVAALRDVALSNARASQPGTAKEIAPDTREYRVAKDLASGTMTYSQFLRLFPSRSAAAANIKADIYDKARDLNPEFSPAAFEAGYKFATNPKTVTAVAAVDNVVPNIDKMIDLSNSWDRTKYPDINRFLGTANVKLGGRTVANIRQAQKLIGDELGTALGGGSMTDMKLQLGLDVVDPNLAPDVFLSNMQRVKEFLKNRKDSLKTPMGTYGNLNTPGAAPGGATAKPVGRYNPTTGKVEPF